MMTVEWSILLMGIVLIVVGILFIQTGFRQKRTGVGVTIFRNPMRVIIHKGKKFVKGWKGEVYTGGFFVFLGIFLSLLAIFGG